MAYHHRCSFVSMSAGIIDNQYDILCFKFTVRNTVVLSPAAGDRTYRGFVYMISAPASQHIKCVQHPKTLSAMTFNMQESSLLGRSNQSISLVTRSTSRGLGHSLKDNSHRLSWQCAKFLVLTIFRGHNSSKWQIVFQN